MKVAHDHGIIHRDLKPANLLIPDDAKQANAVVKLADFGIAKLFGAASQTAHGSIVGTAEFMAPEQAAGKPLNARADLYTLGLVMFTMIAGKPPFRGSQLTEIITKQLRETPPRVSSFHHGIPKELDTLIHELLAKDPANRPASALAVGRRLTAIQDALTSMDHPAEDDSGDGQPSLVIRSEIDPGAPTNHDRSSSLTEATPQDNAPQASLSSIDLLAETKEGTRQGSVDSADNSLDATTELPIASYESPKATGDHKHTDKASSLPAESSQQSVGGSQIPIERRTTKHATSNANKGTASDAADDPNSTVVDTKPSRRFVTVEEYDRAAHQKNAQHRWKRFRMDTLVTSVSVLIVLAVSYWITRPQTADQLFQSITAETQKLQPDLRRIRPELDKFLTRYPEDARAETVAAIQQQLRVDLLGSRMRRRVLGSRDVPAIERDYRAALAREAESPSAALSAMLAIRTVYENKTTTSSNTLSVEDKETWLDLIERQIKRLQQNAQKERTEDIERARSVLREASQVYSEAVELTDIKAAQQQLNQSSLLLQSLIETYGDRPHANDIVDAAKSLLKTIAQFEKENSFTQGQDE